MFHSILGADTGLRLVDEEKEAIDCAQRHVFKASRTGLILDSDDEDVEQNMEPPVCSFPLTVIRAVQLTFATFTSHVVWSKPTAMKAKA